MDFLALEHFQTVVKHGSISKAALALNISQPALSRTITRIENELGYKLFYRTSNTITLNPYGKVFLNHTNQIFKEYQQAQSEMHKLYEQTNKMIKVSLLTGSQLFPELITEFSHSYPDITVQITQNEYTQTPFDYDIQITSSTKKINKKDFIYLFEEEIQLAVPAKFQLSEKNEITRKDLKALNYVALRKGKVLRKMMDNYFSKLKLSPNIVFESDSPELTRQLVHSGLGASFIPALSWSKVNNENIKLLTLTDPPLKRYIYININNNHSIYGQKFIHFLLQKYHSSSSPNLKK